MLVKYSCRCIGFRPDANGKAFLVESCDRDFHDDQYDLFERDVSDKTFEELPPEEVKQILLELAQLILDGNRFREVKRLLS